MAKRLSLNSEYIPIISRQSVVKQGFQKTPTPKT